MCRYNVAAVRAAGTHQPVDVGVVAGDDAFNNDLVRDRQFLLQFLEPLAVLVAADVVRPAAIDQLEVLGKQIDIEVFARRQEQPDAVAVAAADQAAEVALHAAEGGLGIGEGYLVAVGRVHRPAVGLVGAHVGDVAAALEADVDVAAPRQLVGEGAAAVGLGEDRRARLVTGGGAGARARSLQRGLHRGHAPPPRRERVGRGARRRGRAAALPAAQVRGVELSARRACAG